MEAIEKALEALQYSGYKDQEIDFYDPKKKKVLIIKLGEMGDVLRTTPLLLGLKKKYNDILIYWLTKPESIDLLKNNPLIDRILSYNQETILRLAYENFDIVFNFEIDTPATLLANISKAEKKYGYFFHEKGVTKCFNKGAENYLRIAFNDELKKKNRKSYQEMMFEVAELPYAHEKYILEITDEIIAFGEKFLQENNLSKKDQLLGVNIAAGKRWPSKLWSQEKIIECIKQVHNGYNLLLLGGPEEKESLLELKKKLNMLGIKIYSNNPLNSIEEFISVVNLCQGIISTDSLGLHIALALKKKTIALFFSTIENEVIGDDLVKIQSPLNKDFFYVNGYDPVLANSITVDQVKEAMRRLGL